MQRITNTDLTAMKDRLARTAVSAGVMRPTEFLSVTPGSDSNGVGSSVFIMSGTDPLDTYREFPGLAYSRTKAALWRAMLDWCNAVDATRYNRVAPAAHDSAHPRGYYASMWAEIDPANGHTDIHEASGEAYRHTVQFHAPDGGKTNHLNITAEQAERILALISEEAGQ